MSESLHDNKYQNGPGEQASRRVHGVDISRVLPKCDESSCGRILKLLNLRTGDVALSQLGETFLHLVAHLGQITTRATAEKSVLGTCTTSNGDCYSFESRLPKTTAVNRTTTIMRRRPYEYQRQVTSSTFPSLC